MHPILYARLLEARRITTYFVQVGSSWLFGLERSQKLTFSWQFACFVHLFNEHVFEIRPVRLHFADVLKKAALTNLGTVFWRLYVSNAKLFWRLSLIRADDLPEDVSTAKSSTCISRRSHRLCLTSRPFLLCV